MNPPPSVLAAQVRAAREDAIELLRADDPAIAAWAAELGSRTARPAITVAGETNRGKSSLVNALLATEGLSPVTADPVTSRYLVFRHGTDLTASARYVDDRSDTMIELADLPRWVIDPCPPNESIPPRFIEITAPVPLLERFDVIDTPGCGGLRAEHVEPAIEAVAEATALVFVMDASAPLSSGELAFLREISTRIDTVVFALTKIDQQHRWAELLAEDRRLLAEHAPRFADATILPVSAWLFERAATVGETAAEILRERSGIAELQRILCERVAGRRAMLTQANALRGLSSALARRQRVIEARTYESSDAERLRGRRDELLVHRRDCQRGQRLTLRTEVARARVSITHEINKRVRDLRTEFLDRLDGASRRELERVPGQVDHALRTLAHQVAGRINTLVVGIVEAVLTKVFTEAEREAIHARCLRTGVPLVTAGPPRRRRVGAEDRLLVFMGVSGGVSVGKLAAAPLLGLGIAGLSPLVWPITIGLGLGAGYWMARTRRCGADRRHLRQWLTEATTETRSTMERLAAEQLIHTENQLALALDTAITNRIAELDDEIRALGERLRLDHATRESARAADHRRRAELDTARRRCEALLKAMTALR